jgi:hypothetical protein
VLEYSGASVVHQRTFFSTAFEQGLAGAADAAPYGDGDKVVEFNELATFVTIWTAEWARRSSGGRSVQRPVIWRLGEGRVKLEDIPRNIPLLRVSDGMTAKAMAAVRKAVSGATQPASTSASQAAAPAPIDAPAPTTDPASAAPASVAPAPPTGGQPKPSEPATDRPNAPQATASAPRPTAEETSDVPPATKESPSESATTKDESPKPVEPGGPPASAAAETPAPPAPAPPSPAPKPALPERPRDSWEQLAALSQRVGPPPQSVPRASPLDYAPHIWRHAASLLAAASTDSILDGATKARGLTAVDRFNRAITRLADPSPAALGVIRGSPPVEYLRVAERAALESGVPRNWEAASPALRSAMAARNDALELCFSLLEVVGKVSGGAGPLLVQPAIVNDYLEQIGRLSSAIDEVPSTPLVDFDEGRFDSLETAAQNTTSQSLIFSSMAEKMISGIIAAAEASHQLPSGYGLLILLRSRLPEPRQRERLLRLLQAPQREMTLVAQGRPPMPVSATRRIDMTAWKNVAVLSNLLLNLIDATGVRSTETPGRMPSALQPLAGELVECRRAVVALTNAAGDEHAASEIALRLAARISRLYSVAVAAANVPTDDRDGIGKSIDSDRVASLLRILDPRDAVTVGDTMIAGLARWNSSAALGMKLTVAAGEPKGR